MKKAILTSIILLFSNLVIAQITTTSTHKLQENEFGFQEKYTSKFDPQGKDIIPLHTQKSTALSTVVFGFLPYWEYSANAHTNLRYNLLSHIAAFDFIADVNGNISNPSGWPWTDVINAAHNAGTKVIMVVANFNASEINTLLTNSTAKNNLFNNIKNTIATYQLDGVNIDFEGLNLADRGSLINNFMGDLTTYIHAQLPGKEVSFDGPAVNWGGWDFNGLVQNVDHLIIMAYDYNGSWSSTTGAVSPLTHPSNGISVTKTVNSDYGTAIANAASKIVLGVPYYGKHWETATSSAGATVTDYVKSTFYRDTDDDAPLNGGYLWDSNSQTPWFRWNQSGWNQIWAENEQSLALKYDLALNKNLGGIGIWALNYDGNKTDLWDLIDAKFNTALAVDDSFIKQQLHVYPNPAKEQLTILNPKQLKIATIEIYNTYGQKLKNGILKKNVIDLSNLKKAVYFIKIKDDLGNQGTFKIIKS
tara:strand:- start:483057 stop:484481 length:1425 start_codon:yes stop_codon:yes gene_type:complete